MADLQTKSFSTLVSDQVTAVQGGSTALVDFTIGSILRAVVESFAGVVLWLQGLILQVLAMTRAATSTGADLDSFIADYGLTRIGAVAAIGTATFSRFTNTMQAIVPLGTQIQTADGSEQYLVTLDTTNAAYSAAQSGYVLGAGIGSLSVPISAVDAGSAGNAAAGAINTLGQAIAGIDTVSNVSALTNGEDAETDAAVRVRFVRYLASLSKATKSAVAYAATSVQTGIVYNLVENQNYDGSTHYGYFYVVIDDGSGAPPSGLLSNIYAAIDAVRPFTVEFGVFAPAIVTANVVLHISAAAGYTGSAVANTVQASITAYLNSIPLGIALPWSRLIQVAYDASPGVADVTSLTLNGGTSDINITANQVIKAGTVSAATV